MSFRDRLSEQTTDQTHSQNTRYDGQLRVRIAEETMNESLTSFS